MTDEPVTGSPWRVRYALPIGLLKRARASATAPTGTCGSVSCACLRPGASKDGDPVAAGVVADGVECERLAAIADRVCPGPYGSVTDTTHQLSAQTPITVRNSAFTATLPPRSLVTYDIRSR